MALRRIKFMNTYIDNADKEEVISYIESCIMNRKLVQMIPLNVDQIIRIESDPYYKEICKYAEIVVVDGHPLLWIAKWYKRPIKEKICGSDFMPELCDIAAKRKYRVFILGAAPGVAEIAARKLKERNPELCIAGTYSPPFGFENDLEEIKKINTILLQSKSDILFVGMGVPKQEIYIFENKVKYQIPISISVGATIDFIAGVQKRAPRWMNEIGLEWFYRLLHDPKRMFKRYVLDDMRIFWLAWKYR